MPRLDTVNAEILARIAFYAATNSELGPPADLLALLLTCKSIHAAISPPTNYALYADAFRAKFDVEPVQRRFPDRWSTDRCLAKELVKRCKMLRRMRRREVPSLEQLTDDLWTAYLMMLEHDKHNRTLLVRWAGIREFLWQILAASLTRGLFDWFNNREVASLIVWLFWMSMDRDDLLREHPRRRLELQRLLHPFIVASFKYPSFHAPDLHQLVPLDPEEHPPPPSPAPTQPPVRTLTHFSHPLTIACPPLTAGAILCSAARTEMQLALDTAAGRAGWRALTHRSGVQVCTRAQRDAQGALGPAVEDLEEFENRWNVRCAYEPLPGESEKKILGSERWEELWWRLVGCADPYGDGGALRGKVYEFGAAAGRWRGRYVMPSQEPFLTLLTRPARVSALDVPITHRPMYCTLKEHHCLADEQPLDLGADEWGADLLNAWLPRGTELVEREDHLEIYDPVFDRIVRYETLAPPGSSHTYLSKSAKAETVWMDDSDSDDEGDDGDHADAHSNPTYIDSEDWEDTVTHRSSGVSDIILTGETEHARGVAWGRYKFVGRVRAWDGLVCLLRTPADADSAVLGCLVFRGYVQGGNFVGVWRDVNTSLEVGGWECGFVMTRDE
ncbi:hypothetical protein GLOTRDRAFT_122335 [Gloeophyllum trabeum ATCC 11539]|uniref:F-box domain-containing protein n=1 Tax=Gloeophyllum trabeum (strain ATCC 11539 / FP-39264 / Madison 617) TaxID=670483 RepID=S7PZZ6_GLOTA|nr:uncharacterized protein GLOTRDRAFT_122335 [Gloeophyllum trabeum ATCC 11539]EPQ53003.1 hypothetical protein GLOTRDRAFT_122335 [Gloeophyllum trabeum ATCC 11539]